MLKQLFIQNIILIDQTTVLFGEGLNILTGETGSGKSAIMHGLRLAIGDRADTSLIRRGCDKGIVEAVFEIDHADIDTLLIDGGIDHTIGEEIIIRREIYATGKGRIFINHQSVQLAFLRKVGFQLVQIVGQHGNQSLFSIEKHRQIVDLFGDLTPLLTDYQNHYDTTREIENKINLIIQQESQRLREIDLYQRELAELEEAQLKDGEDEEIFSEYTLHANAEEVLKKISEINQFFSGERTSFFSSLNRHQHSLETLTTYDPSLTNTFEALRGASIELQEISHTLRQYQSRLYFDPNKMNFLNERLSLINRLKRKYGPTLLDIFTYQKETKDRLERLENIDSEVEDLRKQLETLLIMSDELAHELSKRRVSESSKLQHAITMQLQSLNMSKAEFIVKVTSQKRCREGDEKVEFFLRANVGEEEVALKDGVSGGELSRILLAIQTLLAGKEKIGTLIFDEIDANIGGETATIIGEKLKEIGKQHQVLCITHFPQVAAKADYHLQVSKNEKEGRTHTTIVRLDESNREVELGRMIGLVADRR